MESFRGELVNLIEHNAVSQEHIDDAVDISNIKPTQKAWVTFINNLFLWIGCVALGFSFIYFLAHNWSQIGRFARFALVETALVLSILVYLKTQIGSVSSSAALTFSTILLGALMALFGQTYQTGADPWQLFFNWALLMTPWALISRFTTIWLVWLGLLNLSITLYCDAHSNPLSLLFGSKVSVLWALFTFNTLSFVAWYKLSQSCLWMQKEWAIRLIALAVGISITSLALFAILDNRVTDNLALPVWVLFLASFYLFYRKLQVNLFMLAGGCLSGIVVTVALLAEALLHQGEPAAYLLVSIIVIGLGVGAAFWLKKVQMEAQV
jgi:uncharacterized membrane protein